MKAEKEERENIYRRLGSKANLKSDRIIQNVRTQRLTEIFEKLDDDQDGEISANKLNTDALSLELFRAFMPLLKELEALN